MRKSSITPVQTEGGCLFRQGQQTGELVLQINVSDEPRQVAQGQIVLSDRLRRIGESRDVKHVRLKSLILLHAEETCRRFV